MTPPRDNAPGRLRSPGIGRVVKSWATDLSLGIQIKLWLLTVSGRKACRVARAAVMQSLRTAGPSGWMVAVLGNESIRVMRRRVGRALTERIVTACPTYRFSALD